MEIEGLNTHIQTANGKIGSYISIRKDAVNAENNSKTKDLKNLLPREAPKNISEEKVDRNKSNEIIFPDGKAVFALDKEDNVVIRFIDDQGKVIRQIPPEELEEMVKRLREAVKNTYSIKV